MVRVAPLRNRLPAALADRRRPALPLLALALGLALAALAFPRLMAALHAVPAGPVLQNLDRPDARPSAGELLAAREALRLAQVWESDGARSVQRARLALTLAAREYQAGGNPSRLVEETIAAARAGLQRAPAQARGWLLLSEATLAASGDPGAAAAYLVESLRASRHDVWLAPNRAELGVRAWPWLDAEERAMVGAQIAIVGARSVERLVAMARRAGDPTPVRAALAGDPDRLRHFDVLYLRGR